MASYRTVLSDKIQDKLDRLAIERTDRLCQIACDAGNYNVHQFYLIMQKDGGLAAIDMEIARVLSVRNFKLKLV